MKIVELSYHELKRVWDRDEAKYVDRDRTSMDELLVPIMVAYSMKSLSAFIKPYVLNPTDSVSLAETAFWMEDREVRLWVTINMYNPLSKYGEIFDSPMIELLKVDKTILDIIWNLTQKKANRLPPFATVRIDLE